MAEREVQPNTDDKLSATEKKRGKVCVCGASYEDFCRTGLLGCALCYTTFRKELIGVVERTQYGTQHVGRTPSGDTGVLASLMVEQARLREEMEVAVKNRNEVEAARIERALIEIDRKICGGIK